MTYVSSLYEIFPKEPTVQETLHDNVSNWKVAPQIYYVTLYVCMNGQLALEHTLLGPEVIVLICDTL